MTAELRALVHQRFVSYARGGRADPSLVLSDNVTAAAAELWRSAAEESSSGAVPYEVVLDLARLHWARHHALPTRQGRNDLQIAMVMFAHLFKIDPESVPDGLHEVLANEFSMEVQDNFGIPALRIK